MIGGAAGPGRVIGVVGACGGAGASVVAACAAHGLRRRGERATLVDLDAHGPGIDLALGTERAPGARWPDLAEARGDVDGAGVVAALPRWGAVPVLSGTARSEPPDDDVVLDVCRGLVRSGESPVLDLPRPAAWGAATRRGTGPAGENLGHDGAAVRTLVAGCDLILLVVPLTLPAAVGAQRVRDRLRAAGANDVRVVARGPAPGWVDGAEVEAALGLPLAGVVPRDPGLARAVERGEGPATSHRAPLGRFAVDLAGAL
ncbi:MAG TPA: septum site-determining protein Ssd [Promicromonospora sp.]|nr:septum site-determining protein Ssd [Promicromonospora sp.]